ncbi:putative orphan protein; putative enzyme [Pseudoalteromonas luteoviolacea B = ATCC 29581]|nr:putative orphan protein; putative enzyme [Pseudoalteromonas luteoviolacea B = ATCC 29581]
MPFAATMFAKHTLGQNAAHNQLLTTGNLAVLDFSGFEATPFLQAELGLSLTRLMAPGLGLHGKLATGESFTLYYFSDTAYRFIANRSAIDALLQLFNTFAADYDLAYMVRDDLAVATLSGQAAFDSLVDTFDLTPGLQLTDIKLCYGAQSGDVFVTSLVAGEEKQFQLVSQAEQLPKWQQLWQDKGFVLN